VFKWDYKIGFGFKVNVMVHELSNLKHVSYHIKQWQDKGELKIKIFSELKTRKEMEKTNPASGT
jgi:hypothetical protein